MKAVKTFSILIAVVLFTFLPWPTSAQGGVARVQIHTTEVDQATGAVHVYFSVLNSQGQAISDLTQQQLIVQDNGRPLETFDLVAERNGLAVILLIDCSGSMLYPPGDSKISPRIQYARDLIQVFTDGYLKEAQDYIGIIKFNTQVVPLLKLGPHAPNDTFNAYANLNAEEGTNTALYSAIRRAMDWFESEQSEVNQAVARRKRVILVFSDGNDGMKSGDPEFVTVAQVESRFAAAGYNIPVFSVGLNTVPVPSNSVYAYAGDDVRWLANATYGRYVEYINQESMPDVRAVYEQINALGNGYQLTFYPRKPESKHTLSIRVQGYEGSGTDDFTHPFEMPKLDQVSIDPPPGVYQPAEEMQVSVSADIAFPDGLPRPVELRFVVKENGQPLGDPVSQTIETDPAQGSVVWTIPPSPEESKHNERKLSFYVELYDTLFTAEPAARSDELALQIAGLPLPTPEPTPVPGTLAPEGSVGKWVPYILLPIVLILLVLLIVFRKQVAASAPVQTATRALQATRRLTMSPVRATLKVTQGGQLGSEFKIRDDEAIIGRGDRCQIKLMDEFVSREHAVLQSQGGQFVLIHRSATNDTQLNGSRMTADTPYPLSSGARIQIGDTVLEFQPAAPSMTRPAGGGRMVNDSQPNARPTKRFNSPGN